MINRTTKYFGAIEAGGTKFICAIGTNEGTIVEQVSIPTTLPEETLAHVIAFFKGAISRWGKLEGLGVGCFGPVDISKNSATYGQIIQTPKRGWSGIDLVGHLSVALNAEVVIDTDVNCALIAEARFGSGKNLQDLVYVTIGTGIGGGVMSNGKVHYGVGHPEIGHIFVPQRDDDLDFDGTCPYHGSNCIEGLASGPAIQKRWSRQACELVDSHEAWDLEAYYLAVLCQNLEMLFAPQKIVLGGGVMKQAHLFPRIIAKMALLNNSYGNRLHNSSANRVKVVPSSLNGEAGILGALSLVL